MSLNLETIDNSYLLFIRSKEVVQLTSNFNSNMKIDLQSGISRNNALQDIHLQLNSCEIPHSFYNFSSNLQNINLYVDGSSSLVLTEQHYDIYELVAFITASSFPYSATFDSQKNKITLTNTDATSHTINFSQTDSLKLSTALGFNQTDRVVGSGASLTSDFSVNLNTIHSIFVHTNLAVNNVITTTNGNIRNIIQKIPVKSMYGEIINYSPTENINFSGVLNTNEIKSLEISLRDQNDLLIDFNNVNFEISLIFEVHNREVNIEEGGGGRRRGLQQPIIPQSLPVIPQSGVLQQPLDQPQITRTQSSIPITQVGQYSQPRPEPSVPVIGVDKSKEDELLSDKMNNELQKKLLDLELIDDII